MLALLLVLLLAPAAAASDMSQSNSGAFPSYSTVTATGSGYSVQATNGSIYSKYGVFASTGTFGGGASGLATLEVRFAGNGGVPPTSGSGAANTRFRIGANDGNVLDFGNYASSPYGVWLQANDRGNFATTYPMALQPNGGSVGIGTASPCSTCTLHVGGGASITGNFNVGNGTFTVVDGFVAIGYDATTPDARLAIKGTTNTMYLMYKGDNTEDVYIRGGKSTSDIYVGDTTSRSIYLGKSGGVVKSQGTFELGPTASPASNAACTAGQIVWDASYIYICTASGAWKRAALTGGY